MIRIRHIPLFLAVSGIMALAMFVPAAHAVVHERFAEARAFFYSGTLGLFAVGLIIITLSARPRKARGGMTDLAALFAIFIVLPLFLAVPFHDAVQTTSFLNAYFEMVSALTTTGATLFAPERLSESLHLWRALVGWLGGLIMWVAAAAILAPLNLGGFEVTASAEPGQDESGSALFGGAVVNLRLQRSVRALVPIYAGLTLVLWLCLVVARENPFVALTHAMSTMATSGISPVGGTAGGEAGFAGELIIFLFLFFALSRLTFSSDTLTSARPGLLNDPEFRIGLLLVAGVPLILFLRHWIASFEVATEENFAAAAHTLWGGIFTVMSFLTTTGFESADWSSVRAWSGLGSPGMILLGLSLIGGGVATTAGGVKLLRVYALYLNGFREMDRLVHPSSVGRASGQGRRIRRKGAFVAWIFFMLFAISLAIVTALLTLTGIDFENAIVLAVASLSTTGPLVSSAADAPMALADMSAAAKLIFSGATVLGRLETLAIIALANPALWRD